MVKNLCCAFHGEVGCMSLPLVAALTNRTQPKWVYASFWAQSLQTGSLYFLLFGILILGRHYPLRPQPKWRDHDRQYDWQLAELPVNCQHLLVAMWMSYFEHPTQSSLQMTSAPVTIVSSQHLHTRSQPEPLGWDQSTHRFTIDN